MKCFIKNFNKSIDAMQSDNMRRVAAAYYKHKDVGIEAIRVAILSGTSNQSSTRNRRYLINRYGYDFDLRDGKYYLIDITMKKSAQLLETERQNNIRRKTLRQAKKYGSHLSLVPPKEMARINLLNEVFA